MKKAFTLIELTIVIVILGILGTISVEILQKLANNYVMQKEMNRLAYKTDLTLNIIASKLKTRIKNSVIASHCNDSGIPDGDFIAVSQLTPQNSWKYRVLEWLNYSVYSKRGMWNGTKIQPGWSGFVDLKDTNSSNGGDEYNISTPDSNFSIVQQIDGNWFHTWGINGYNNIFNNKRDVLVFSGSDGRGDLSDINNSYGWYEHNATRVFAIGKLSDTELNLSAVDESNSTTVYEGYYIINSAEAVVPVKSGNEYNLTLRFNYFPWLDQNYTDGNVSILATHVTKFKFKEENGLLRIYVCITSANKNLRDYNLTICKEKVVF
ncbi:type II secretion system protein [Lebetimonas sp. JS032]|uniref:type II secretion system protein n=1 Tax=Lebetimonas sp. JS032 TaxID=990070 RepID=UPI000466E37F|nr:prepilin-type N-terminal cleavage/methylation domain-containing protein [Lebetimonas sp. JS032]